MHGIAQLKNAVEVMRRVKMNKAEAKKLLELFLEDAISKVGFELSADASLDLKLKADSGYQSNLTYKRINALQWVLVQSILESDIGKKKEKPVNQLDSKKYPIFNLFPNKKTTS